MASGGVAYWSGPRRRIKRWGRRRGSSLRHSVLSSNHIARGKTLYESVVRDDDRFGRLGKGWVAHPIVGDGVQELSLQPLGLLFAQSPLPLRAFLA